MPASQLRILLAAVSCGLAALPFLSVTLPPLTDLPQHVAQVRLLHEALADPAGPYRIQWLTPYSTVYWLLALLWTVLQPMDVGRVGALLIALLSTAALHAFAAARGRSPWAAVLASLLVFSHVLYWGFFSFALGWPVFLLWVWLTGREGPFGWKRAAAWVACSTLLYLTHALWFAAAGLWLLVDVALAKLPPRQALARLATMAPVAVVALLWWPRFSSGFSTPPLWISTPLERLAFPWWSLSVFGGLHGYLEDLALLLLLAWLLLGWRSRRQEPGAGIDGRVLAAALLLLSVAFLAPDKFMNTIQFASRWAPMGLALLLLAIPAPAVRDAVRGGAALALAAIFALSTALAWSTFEEEELDGLAPALAALPEKPRVLGLDFLRNSQVVQGRPFVQTFAYAQVARGGELNFSFADFAPSLVVYKDPFRRQWTAGLEWFPERVQPSDFAHFDFALIGGLPETHDQLAAKRELEPVTDEGLWRLYRIAPKGTGRGPEAGNP